MAEDMTDDFIGYSYERGYDQGIDDGRRIRDALHARISELEAQLSAGNDWLNARSAILQDLAEANARISELEKELAAERSVTTCVPRGWR